MADAAPAPDADPVDQPADAAGADAAGADAATVEVEVQPVLASAPGVGTSIGALNVSTLSVPGWVVVGAGILGTLLIAVSYLAGWLTATLEHFGVPETESLGMAEATSGGLSWMYRLATLGLIGCAFGLLFAPEQSRSVIRLAGFAASGLGLLSAAIATLIIGTVLAQGAAYFGDAETVGYGWGVYAAFLGIAGVTSFVGLFERVVARR